MIVVDVGNSAVTTARIEHGDLRPDAMDCLRLGDAPTPHGDADGRDLISRLTDLRRDDEPIRVVSVVPTVTEMLVAAFEDVRIADHRCALPFELALDDPAATGADRFANMAAAAAMGWPTALVVDAGTATTFDVLRDGVFIGGLIAPGMAMAARVLGERAARLSEVPFGPVDLEPGRNTADAMSAGGFHAGVHGVIGVLRRLREDLGGPPVVLCGGLAHHLVDAAVGADLPPDVVMDRDWTLKGAALLTI